MKGSSFFQFSPEAFFHIQIYALEAAPERTFSVFQALFSRVRMAAGHILASGELRIQPEQVYDEVMVNNAKV
jgi:hypothetical protein